jgi:hypothetical protein
MRKARPLRTGPMTTIRRPARSISPSWTAAWASCGPDMTEQPGLFAVPDPPSAAPVPAPRDRGRRGEHWTRTVVADLHIVASRALRDAAQKVLSKTVTVNLGPADDDSDLLEEHQEIATSKPPPSAGGDPTTGIWPDLAEALRLDVVDIDATDETTRRARAHWSGIVTITDIRLLRARAPARSCRMSPSPRSGTAPPTPSHRCRD